jgi:predicted aspartyl protease
MTIHANDIPLQDILQELENAGIKVRANTELNPNITASFENKDLQEGLAQILQSLDYVLIWKTAEGSAGSHNARQSRLAQVLIFKEKEREQGALFREERGAPDTPLPESETKVTIAENRVYVPVTLQHNGKEIETTLVLDTGATTMLLHEEIADQLEFDDYIPAKGYGVGGIEIGTKATRIDLVTVGPHRKNSLRVDVVPYQGPKGEYFSGLLGMNFLSGIPFRIDYEKQVICWGE